MAERGSRKPAAMGGGLAKERGNRAMGHLAHNDPISVPTGSKILEIAIGSAAAHGSCSGSCSGSGVADARQSDAGAAAPFH